MSTSAKQRHDAAQAIATKVYAALGDEPTRAAILAALDREGARADPGVRLIARRLASETFGVSLDENDAANF